MLEFIRQYTQGRIAKVILALIVIPFALFGIDTYFQSAGSSADLAEVNGEKITLQEFDTAMQNLRNKLQQESEKPDLSMLEDPSVKTSMLDKLVNEKLVLQEAQHGKFVVSDEQLTQQVIQMEEFKRDGKFSQELFDQVLSQSNLTSTGFEALMRKDILLNQVRDGFADLTYMPKATSNLALTAEYQAREVSVANINAKDFLPKVSVKPEEIKAYYDKNTDKFRTPEQVKLEFVLLSATMMVKDMVVNDDEVKAFYNANAQQFQGDEQRRASHILISFGVGATPEAKEEARKKAEQVLAEVKKPNSNFEELAKKYSQDPGSAEKGGDLGAFGRGAMVKPFEDAVFAMKPGEISNTVESEFGYHIIKLTEITGAAQSFDSVKPQIKGELMYQKALTKFSEEAESFSNMVYEQSSSLEPAAKAFGLTPQKTEWMSREEVAKFFKSEKIALQVFSDEGLKQRRNTEAAEALPNSLVSVRVIDHRPSAVKPFDTVSVSIEEQLKLEAANKMAAEKGEALISELRQGKPVAALKWSDPVKAHRRNPQELSQITMANLFKVDVKTLPAYLGVANAPNGYHLIRVTATEDYLAGGDQTEKDAAKAELENTLRSEYLTAYIKNLKSKAKLSTRLELLKSPTD